MHVDRRLTEPPTVGPKRRRLWIEPAENSAAMTIDSQPSEEVPEPEPDFEEKERRARIAERWRFDEDDAPAVGPQGSDEHDRMLLDDFDLK
jgi:enhancer of polycomb-like protein